ncbi:hypothetical protein QMK19_38630 [Streptomyces sp. H10-C2]|uniref:hypothetical protein n=1 Tax=unclassified Streptomyces TaxID=2593676 RepID=UPI0024BA3AB6|nr:MULTISPECIES: hypothetical protein [unclassified Streptomyces]MDJ0346819.1 hypothetical protein [Streptomyces sp. PH10-H1]MDJ0375356.1 hypothetical protein [Streptomyces sp. H10-C2]
MTFLRATIRTDLDLPGIGTLTARVTALEHGRLRYVVRGPHIRGTFVVIPEHHYDGTVIPSTVSVQYGDGVDPHGDYYSRHRPDEPVVYNVRVHGWTGGLNPHDLPSGYFLGRYAENLRDNGVCQELPRGVRRRTEVVILAIVMHWRQVPHLHALLTAAALPQAARFAAHENELATAAGADARQLDQQRAQMRSGLNVITGIIRRATRPVRAADPAAVSLPLTDDRGHFLGSVNVREVAVNDGVAGSVVYEVHGARVHGRFTVGRNIYRAGPLPDGIWVAYGQATRRHFEHERAFEPTINGVPVSGHWDRHTTADLTATTPPAMPARVRLSRTTGTDAPAATERRASAVLRALALHYLARPDIEALRLAAAQERAPEARYTTRAELRSLRARHHTALARAEHHRGRQQQYLELLPQDIETAPNASASRSERLRAA